MGKDRATAALALSACLLGVIAAIGVLTFAAPCAHDDGTVSVCHDAQIAIIAAAIAAAACAGLALALRSRMASGVLLVAAALAGGFIAIVPGNVLPLCMMASMRCHVVMQPFAHLVGAALAAVSLIGTIRVLRSRA